MDVGKKSEVKPQPVQAQKKILKPPLFHCLVEGCDERSNTPHAIQVHMIKVHRKFDYTIQQIKNASGIGARPPVPYKVLLKVSGNCSIARFLSLFLKHVGQSGMNAPF